MSRAEMFAADERDFRCLLFDAKSRHEKLCASSMKAFEDDVSFHSLAQALKAILFTILVRVNMTSAHIQEKKN